MRISTTISGLVFVLATPVAFAGPAVDPRQEGAAGARTTSTAPTLCGQRCRHELQGRAALNYVASPRPVSRD